MNKYIILLIINFSFVYAGIISSAICYTGCNGMAIACYSAAGLIFGTVLAISAPAAILACNAAQGSCMVSCSVATLPLP
jgi:hypothetical protein